MPMSQPVALTVRFVIFCCACATTAALNPVPPTFGVHAAPGAVGDGAASAPLTPRIPNSAVEPATAPTKTGFQRWINYLTCLSFNVASRRHNQGISWSSRPVRDDWSSGRTASASFLRITGCRQMNRSATFVVFGGAAYYFMFF